MTRLGVGAHVPFSKLDDRTFAAALQSATQSAVSLRARRLAAILERENGLAAAADVVEADGFKLEPLVGRLGSRGEDRAERMARCLSDMSRLAHT